jgi:hypothetical protein
MARPLKHVHGVTSLPRRSGDLGLAGRHVRLRIGHLKERVFTEHLLPDRHLLVGVRDGVRADMHILGDLVSETEDLAAVGDAHELQGGDRRRGG